MPKVTTERWQVSTKAEKGSDWVRVGRDHYTQSIIRATFAPLGSRGLDPDDSRPDAEMLIALDETKRPQIHALTLRSNDAPITATGSRLPLAAMARIAVACESYRLEGEVVHLVALSGDVFEIAKKSGTTSVEHAAPERLARLERDARTRRGPRLPRNVPSDDDLERVWEIRNRVPYRERRAAVQAEMGCTYSQTRTLLTRASKRFGTG